MAQKLQVMRAFYTHQNLCPIVRNNSQISDHCLDYIISSSDTDFSAIEVVGTYISDGIGW